MSPRRLVRGGALALLIAGGGLLAAGAYIPAKAALAQVLLERAFVQQRAGDKSAKPWPWADVRPIARIWLPDAPHPQVVLDGTSGEAMAFGPGRVAQSAAIGTRGTTVLAAHRDTHFAGLATLTPGDLVALETTDGRHRHYRVRERRVVAWNASGLDAGDRGSTGERLALVTCYPFGAVAHGPLRYVVIAERVPDAPSP